MGYGRTNSWNRAFLRNRKQEVILDGARSSHTGVLYDVPQGSVPGPMLFLAYINDLPKSIRTSDYRFFADDNLLYCIDNKDADRDLQKN